MRSLLSRGKRSALATSVLLVALCAKCGSEGGVTRVASSIQSIHVSPNSIQMNVGDEHRIDVQGVSSDGASVPLGNVQWTVPPTITVTGSGSSIVVRATQGGHGWVVAHANGFADSASIDVSASPIPSGKIILDLRKSLQQASTIDQAFALFGIVDHTPYRGARNTSGWSFTTNADGQGLHALRADWEASPSPDQGIRVIHYLQNAATKDLWVQWKGRVGKYATDPDANGADDSYATFPASLACKRALFGNGVARVDFVLHRSTPEAAKVEVGAANYAQFGNTDVWNFNQTIGGKPFTTTVHVKSASTDAAADGVFQLWIDGTQVMDEHDVPAMAAAWTDWSFPTTCVSVPQPQSEYFWDLVVWTP